MSHTSHLEQSWLRINPFSPPCAACAFRFRAGDYAMSSRGQGPFCNVVCAREYFQREKSKERKVSA